jgi:hypothetical protein
VLDGPYDERGTIDLENGAFVVPKKLHFQMSYCKEQIYLSQSRFLLFTRSGQE